MFKKILIANRGEVALRIIYACRELGIKTVAVYSEADENSLHVRFADEDVCIGPARSADSYLNVPAVISAAEITGADADPSRLRVPVGERVPRRSVRSLSHQVHRSRSAGDPADGRQGARAARDAEGRRADSAGQRRPDRERGQGAQDRQGDRLSGDRQGDGRRRRPRHARRAAPVGAAARRSRPRSARPRRRSASATSTSRSTSSRRAHIEFQILGDQHGGVVHLGERECSIQRRHQKLIEESPSPALSEKMRRKMGGDRHRRRQGGAVHQRRHVRVPDGSGRPLLLHGSEHRVCRSSIRSPKW